MTRVVNRKFFGRMKKEGWKVEEIAGEKVIKIPCPNGTVAIVCA